MLLIAVINAAMRLDGVRSEVTDIIIGSLLVVSVVAPTLLTWVSGLVPVGPGGRRHRPTPPPPPPPPREHPDPSSNPAQRKATTHMSNHTRRLSALAVLALTASLSLTACGGDDERLGSDGGGGGGGDGGSLHHDDPQVARQPLLRRQHRRRRACRRRVRRLGRGGRPGTGDAGPDSQVAFIQTATQQGVGALVVSANDPSALCDSIEQAQEVDIKVVTFDSDTECRDVFVSQADAQGIATKQIELIADQIGGSGDIAILSAAANATNQNEWIGLMEEDLEANYPDITLVDTVYGDDDDQKSFDETAALLQANPDLKGIVSPTTVGIAAAARYLSTRSTRARSR